MKKKITKLLLLSIFLLIAAKGFIVVSAYQVMNAIKQENSNDFLLTYEWVSSSFTGVITFEGVQFTPFTMKKTFNVDALSLHYSDFISMILHLSSLKDSNVEAVNKVVIDGLRSEFKGKSFKDLIAEMAGSAKWLKPFDLYGCSGYEGLTPDAFQAMGVNEWKASILLERQDSEEGTDVLSISMDQYELGFTQIVTEWPNKAIDNFVREPELEALTLLSLDLEYQDAGFFRRLNILCNDQAKSNREQFSRRTAAAWQLAMNNQGLLVNSNLASLYGDFILQGGTLSMQVKPTDGIALDNLKALLNKELLQDLNVTLDLNGKSVTSAALYVDGMIIDPPIPEPVVAAAEENISPKLEPGYRLIATEQINEFEGRKIRVIMFDEKRYEGILTATTEYNIELTQNLPGGTVHYPLMLNEIKQIEAWFNQ